MPKLLLALAVTTSLAAAPAPPVVEVGRTSSTIKLDGRLDETAWEEAGTIPDLVQQEPRPGEPTAFSTRARILLSGDSLYLGVECHDPAPDRIAVHTLQRDGSMRGDDHLTIVLDTFRDGRTGYLFRVNAAAARFDGLISGPGELNEDWDGIWDARARRTADGWVVEIEIPARTLRFTPESDRWGFNLERRVARERLVLRWAGATLDSDLEDLSRAGTLVGLDGLTQGTGLSVSPYGLGRLESDDGVGTRRRGTGGLDLGYNFTPELAGVLTLNTDFAETEVDTRRINLTRFPLFFPEKRAFFLEGGSLFEFGTGLGTNFLPFYSRRLGLRDRKLVPIDAGLKIVGRAGRWGVAALDVQTGETGSTKATNLSAARLTCDASERLRVGALATWGDPDGVHENGLAGLDALWHTSAFRGDKNLTVSAWTARTWGPVHEGPPEGDRTGWGFKVDYPNDLWDLFAQMHTFGDALDPALGFLQRPGTRRYQVGGAWQPRPSGPPFDWARQFFFELSATRVNDLEGRTESWHLFTSPFNVVTRSGEHLEVDWQPQYDRVDAAFPIAPDSAPEVVIPPGSYRFDRYGGTVESSGHRRWLLGGSVWFGGFYGGRLTQWSPYLRWNSPMGRFQLKLQGEGDFGSLPAGRFAQRLFQLQLIYAFSPDLVLSSYSQYDSESRGLGMNNRLRLTLRPGNDLYVVWNRNWVRPLGMGSLELDPVSDQVAVKLRWTFRP